MERMNKPLYWVGNSYKELVALPKQVRRQFGYALGLAQLGERDPSVKPLSGFGGAAVLEVVENDAAGTYRAVYSVRFPEAVFVLHCFQKKSTSGIATPKTHMNIIRDRLKLAAAHAQELRHANTDRQRH